MNVDLIPVGEKAEEGQKCETSITSEIETDVKEQEKDEIDSFQKTNISMVEEKPKIARKRGRPRKDSQLRGRPKKKNNNETDPVDPTVDEQKANVKILGEKVAVFDVPRGKRGRPRKTEVKREVTSTSLLSVLEMKSPRSCKRSAPWEENDVDATVLDQGFTKKKRGRPKKESVTELTNVFSLKREAKSPKKYSDTSMMLKNKYSKMKFAPKVGRPKKQVFSLPSVILPPKKGRPKKVPTEPMVAINGHKNDILPVAKICRSDKPEDPLTILTDTCNQMHQMEWASGKCGGASIKFQGKIYVATELPKRATPSEKISVYNDTAKNEQVIKESDVVMMKIFQITNAGAVVHCQSTDAVIATLLSRGNEFRITHQDVISGIQNSSFKFSHKFDDILVIPIVHNTLSKEELAKRLQFATEMNPDANAVLVRRQGIYIWSDSLPNAISQAECYHHLFQTAMKMRQIGIEPDQYPRDEYGLTG